MEQLAQIQSSQIATFEQPSLRIKTDDDVESWKLTSGYRNYAVFVRRLNEAVVGHDLPVSTSEVLEATTKVLAVLDELARWTDDIPPLPTPQRFGNLAFREWGKRLEERSDALIASILPDDLCETGATPLLRPYFITAFGSFSRIDYGTGHELSFALFLLCLSLLRVFEPKPAQECELVLVVFGRYLEVVWKLQDVYKLEPAGSHGVWGLDDYAFLPYLWGSAQLRESDTTPDIVLSPSPPPPSNLYFASIERVRALKRGPFHEHSAQLHAIATGVPRWAKVNGGMFKMYAAEVLGKRVVVQHVPLGGLLAWDPPDHSTAASTGTQGVQAATGMPPLRARWDPPATMVRGAIGATVAPTGIVTGAGLPPLRAPIGLGRGHSTSSAPARRAMLPPTVVGLPAGTAPTAGAGSPAGTAPTSGLKGPGDDPSRAENPAM